MSNLTANERSFISMMGKSDEHMRKGFELILKRSCFVKYFSSLNENGFFHSSRNPAPVHVEPDRVQIPYWKAVDYLVACARWAGEKEDFALARRIIDIVRAVSCGNVSTDSHDNYHTYRAFAEIVGLLPIESVVSTELALVEHWLSTRFDRSMVVQVVHERVLSRLLESDERRAWNKAVQLIGYCTAIRWQATTYGSDGEEPVGVVDEYWLKELVDHHALSLGERCGASAASLFADRVREVFGRGARAKWSHIFRAAVEEDGQNAQYNSVENAVVVGLRDVLLSWCDVDVISSKAFVDSLLQDDNEMIRRIGIFVVGRRWDDLRSLYCPIVRPDYLNVGHLHELYGLLHDKFALFSDHEKAATIEAIRNLSEVSGGKPELRERFQHRWLSAIEGTTYGPAVEWLAELERKYGRIPDYPEYLSRTETRWGPGPSRYSAQELISFAGERSLVNRLIEFEAGDPWKGPTVEALVDELERAVGSAPDQFAYVLQDFIDAPREYQYGLVNGFLKLWLNPEEGASRNDWAGIWSSLFEFFMKLVRDPRFWEVDDNDSRIVQPSAISNALADLLDHGARDDNRAYPVALLPCAWTLIRVLVEYGEPVTEPIHDPMNQSINSSKGRALEAAFSHVLRRCRISDSETGSHAQVWSEVAVIFDEELDQCTGKNFAFSTLCGAYLGQLKYIDPEWLQARIRDIFPSGHPTNLRCAVGGLAYAPASRDIFRMLRDEGIIEAALRIKNQERGGREKLMERLMLGYLWGDESLRSGPFSCLFQSARSEDFDLISSFFRHIRREVLSPDQVGRIVDYWRYCVEWAEQQTRPTTWLLAGLSVLTSFLTTAKGCGDLLCAVAAHVGDYHETYGFISELSRLAVESPAEVRDAVAVFVDTHGRFYDYEGRMLDLIQSLAQLGYRDDAIGFCEKLHLMAGMDTLFNELTA